MRFYVGTHVITHAKRFERCMISVNRLAGRRADFEANEWMLDSGAFTTILKYGAFIEGPEVYAAQVDRWSQCGTLVAAASQDYMCDPIVLDRTGMTVAEHQQLTIDRYDAIRAAMRSDTYLMPVLQGQSAESYVSHVRQYGDRIGHGAWVGVGSIVRRSRQPMVVYDILSAIKHERPDIQLHGFGIKLASLRHPGVLALLATSDSMAWSFAARRMGGDPNAYEPAREYIETIDEVCRAKPTTWHIQGRLL